MESQLVKTKNDTDYPDYVKSVCEVLKDYYGFSIRITDFWSILITVLSLDEFGLMDYKLNLNGQFYSYLLDECIKWREGKPVDFHEIYEAMLINGDFTKDEKLLFEGCDILDILWAIFIIVNNPGINFN